jgi:purine-binding chemotaxis protein CheW
MSQVQTKSQATTTKQVKLVTFGVGNLNAALHIDVVQRVINYSTIYSSGLNHFGIINLGDQEITVIDLHKRLFNTSQPVNPSKPGYLVLVKNSVNEIFGIVVSEAPSLLDVSLDNIRVLPPSYRQADTLSIASHVTVIHQEQGELAIFILVPDELVPPVKS